jgi:hypothetical protein
MPANRRAKPPARRPKPVRRNDGRTFVVIGHRAVAGAKPGEIVTAPLTVEQADALVEAGHVEEYVDHKPSKPLLVDLDEAGHFAVAENPTEER